MNITEEMIEQLSGYSDRFKILALKQWEARGYDLGEHGKMLEGPSLARRVTNFGKAMAGHVKNGCKLAPVEEQARRLAICQGCDFYGLKKPGVCGHKDCGCSMRVKVTLASSSCPATPKLWDKWTGDSTCAAEQSGAVEDLNHLPLAESVASNDPAALPLVSIADGQSTSVIAENGDKEQQKDTSEFHDGN